MPTDLPDLTNLTFLQLGTYLVLTAAADTIFNTVLAIVHQNFSAAYFADFIRSHLLMRVTAILIVASFGHGVPALGVPSIPAISLAATTALGAYIVETVWSIKGALTDTKPVPSPPTPTPEG